MTIRQIRGDLMLEQTLQAIRNVILLDPLLGLKEKDIYTWVDGRFTIRCPDFHEDGKYPPARSKKHVKECIRTQVQREKLEAIAENLGLIFEKTKDKFTLRIPPRLRGDNSFLQGLINQTERFAEMKPRLVGTRDAVWKFLINLFKGCTGESPDIVDIDNLREILTFTKLKDTPVHQPKDLGSSREEKGSEALQATNKKTEKKLKAEEERSEKTRSEMAKTDTMVAVAPVERPVVPVKVSAAPTEVSVVPANTMANRVQMAVHSFNRNGVENIEKEIQKKYISENEKLNEYYTYFRGQLLGFMNACSILHTGMLSNTRKNAADYVGEALSSASSAIPFAGIILKILGSTILKINNINKETAINNGWEFFTKAVCSIPYNDNMEHFADMVARKLTLEQEPVLLKLEMSKKVGIIDKMTANDASNKLRALAKEHAERILENIFKGIKVEKNNAADYCEAPVKVILGNDYQSITLSQIDILSFTLGNSICYSAAPMNFTGCSVAVVKTPQVFSTNVAANVATNVETGCEANTAKSEALKQSYFGKF